MCLQREQEKPYLRIRVHRSDEAAHQGEGKQKRGVKGKGPQIASKKLEGRARGKEVKVRLG